jgi:hypothetical protein
MLHVYQINHVIVYCIKDLYLCALFSTEYCACAWVIWYDRLERSY